VRQALVIVTALYAILLWRALRMTVLDIPFGDRPGFIAKVTAVIQKAGFPPPTSRDNQLVFYSAALRSVVGVTMSEAAAVIRGPISTRTALQKAFPEAVEKPAGKLRVRAVAIVSTVWAVTVALILLVSSLL
jgi:hypothetical protein